MNFIQAVVLGLVQGLTEFLPVSSSAHLVLIPWFFKWDDPGLAFDVALHWGTLIGVIGYYWRDLLKFALEFRTNKIPWYLVAATIPGAAIGFLFEKQAETIFRSPLLIAGTLSLMGILLLFADKKSAKIKTLNDLQLWQALVIGFSQGLAIVPGISRSGITITTALLLGFERGAAVQFSFLLSIPIIAGAGILKLPFLLHNISSPVVLTGIVTAAVSGFAAISILVNYVRTKSFSPFVIYRLALAAVVVIWITAK